MGWVETLIDEVVITISMANVHLAIVQAIVLGTLFLILGIWVSRSVGLLERDAPAGETLAVGLATGLIVGAALWAALASGGRSSFTPSAVGFALAVVIAITRPRPTTTVPLPSGTNIGTRAIRWAPAKRVLIVAALAAASVAAAGVLFGSTMVLSPRDGVQPIEFMDEAFYSILGADIGHTGMETVVTTSGFAHIQRVPVSDLVPLGRALDRVRGDRRTRLRGTTGGAGVHRAATAPACRSHADRDAGPTPRDGHDLARRLSRSAWPPACS